MWAAHGRQHSGQRWQLSPTHESRYDEVEHLLSALKQLVAAFDMMDGATKQQVPCAGDVIRNSSHLVRLAKENADKFAEMVEAKEERRAEEEAARKSRQRSVLQRYRERDRRSLRPIDVPPAERYPSASGAQRRVPSATASTAQRPPSPKLRPLTSAEYSNGTAGPPCPPPGEAAPDGAPTGGDGVTRL